MSPTATPQSPSDSTVRRLGIAEVFDVDSSSTEGKVYRVTLNPDRCNCRHRGPCQHIRRAREQSTGVTGHTTSLAEAVAVHFLAAHAEEADPAMPSLPRDVGAAFLTARGWHPGPTGGWVSPSGTHRWVMAECLEVAITAEVAELLR